jgi:hypothetical protein
LSNPFPDGLVAEVLDLGDLVRIDLFALHLDVGDADRVVVILSHPPRRSLNVEPEDGKVKISVIKLHKLHTVIRNTL